MSSSLPPAPGSRPPTLGATLEELADRLGTSVRAVLAGGVLAVLALAGVALLWFRDEPAAPELSMPYAAGVEVTSDATVPSTTAQTVPGEVTIHVAGAVRNPGVYVVPADARVGDALGAAGGPGPGADLDRLNLASPLADGSRIYVPLVGEADVPSVLGPHVGVADGPEGGTAGGLVDLNRADPAALEQLPGVGPSTAAAIVAHREQHGPFRTVDDLLQVRGIGEAKLAGLRDLVTVDGG